MALRKEARIVVMVNCSSWLISCSRKAVSRLLVGLKFSTGVVDDNVNTGYKGYKSVEKKPAFATM
jgi:Pyruvate/2-oxoacid:ferredoxin oxidoreductase gamma subunit